MKTTTKKIARTFSMLFITTSSPPPRKSTITQQIRHHRYTTTHSRSTTHHHQNQDLTPQIHLNSCPPPKIEHCKHPLRHHHHHTKMASRVHHPITTKPMISSHYKSTITARLTSSPPSLRSGSDPSNRKKRNSSGNQRHEQ